MSKNRLQPTTGHTVGFYRHARYTSECILQRCCKHAKNFNANFHCGVFLTLILCYKIAYVALVYDNSSDIFFRNRDVCENMMGCKRGFSEELVCLKGLQFQFFQSKQCCLQILLHKLEGSLYLASVAVTLSKFV